MAPLHSKLDARARQLLRALIAQYIAEGEPARLAHAGEECGFGYQPGHDPQRDVGPWRRSVYCRRRTHRPLACRPPRDIACSSTACLNSPLDEPQVDALRRELPTLAPTQDLLNGVSSLLSDVTHFVGVVTVPKREEFPFKHIDFVPLGGNRVLVILVFADNDVQNRVVVTQRMYSAGDLEHVANFLNANYAGLRMSEIRERLLREMRETSHNLHQLMVAAVDVTQNPFPQNAGADMLVAGQMNLMGSQGLSNMDRLRELFEAFQRKRDLLVLLENCASAEGVRLFIGEESGFAALDACSVITAPYGVEGRILGVLGVIGPTRMAYQRVIPVVQATANILSSALNSSQQTQ